MPAAGVLMPLAVVPLMTMGSHSHIVWRPKHLPAKPLLVNVMGSAGIDLGEILPSSPHDTRTPKPSTKHKQPWVLENLWHAQRRRCRGHAAAPRLGTACNCQCTPQTVMKVKSSAEVAYPTIPETSQMHISVHKLHGPCKLQRWVPTPGL